MDGGEQPDEGAQAVRRAARPAKDHSRSAPREAALSRIAFRTASVLPLGALHGIGALAGRGLGAWETRERLATRVNVDLCFPELDAAARTRLVRQSLIETGRTMAELAALWCWPKERVLALAQDVRGEERFLEAAAKGAVIALTPHLGAWEFSGLYVASRVRLTALYKPPPIREMEQFYTAARERTGAKLVPADATGVRALHRALRSGEVAGILPDQDPGRGSGVFAPYFGRPANTTTLVAKLAEKSGAPLFLVWSERLVGRGFRVHFVEAQDPQLRDRDVLVAVTAMNRAIEGLIRTHPEQYLWGYKRFRHTPPGVENPYRLARDSEEG